MEEYNPQKVEPKWQKHWEEKGFYRAEDFSKKSKKYILVEFPYPSGEGLHVGHVRSYSALDALSRKKRMEGENVLFPIGWDAFGLPTENYAIKNNIHPSKATEKNVANFKRQLKSLGLSFDWSREVNTTDPEYYKWTQWIFLKLFEKGLAYKTEIPVNWCPSCKIGLANEEVVDGTCERCHTAVGEKVLKQWMIRITKYADRLIDDLKDVDFPERVKTQQINWIGRSEGTEIDFKIENSEDIIKVFTTRVDTIFGVTALVVAPENKLAKKLITQENKEKAEKYIEDSKKKSSFEREKVEKEKTGIFTGSYCLNPANGEKVPIWIGDYVVAEYGGGAVMMVPAHDQRDFEFAKKYTIDIRVVIIPENDILGHIGLNKKFKTLKELRNNPEYDLIVSDVSRSIIDQGASINYGVLINSGEFSKLSSKEAIEKITEWLEKRGLGKRTVHYKLRDWVFSRQHYWGEPIPIIHCQKCGQVPVPEKDLPIKLPFVEKYQPTGTGESPLSAITDWVNAKCPKCKGQAKRETDTMPNWAGSNWYYLRYLDPKNNKALADSKKIKYWMPVDWYNGGMEHTTLHLLYSRFIYKFLFDIGAVPQKEPYQKRTSHGMVLAQDGRKMSKSFGNVINPDDIVKQYGADTLRLYEMFMGPFEQAIAWDINGLKGVYRFLDKVWKLKEKISESKPNLELERLTHQTIKKVTGDLETLNYNTAISALMILVNAMSQESQLSSASYLSLLKLTAPLAPHITEELWRLLGNKDSIHNQRWPEYDEKLLQEDKVFLMIQINGKIRDRVEVKSGILEEEARQLTISRDNVKKWIAGKEIKKIIFVPDKLINIVI